MRAFFVLLPVLTLAATFTSVPALQATEPRPNILLIYADDLGYGDLSCYGATKLQTPNIDKLAAEGLRFTDGHAAAATCTPSRYAMLTGEYAWRKKGTGVLPGDAALIIPLGTPTLPSLLQQAGYATAIVGKWHLGLGAVEKPLNWNAEVAPGPLEVGFTSSFIMAATGDRVPCVLVRDHKVLDLDPADPITVAYDHKVGVEPTGKENPELLSMRLTHGHDQTIINGISRIGYMSGGKNARWRDTELGDRFAQEAVRFVEQTDPAKPFFLLYAAHEPHVPRVPHPRFAGKSSLGPRGDVILQFDSAVGEILAALQRKGLVEKTLVILTSDNGPVLDDGYQDQAVELLGEHKLAGPLRGGKYSLFEGGTRVPFIVRWPGRVKPGLSSALVSQVDFPATLAKLVGPAVPAGAAKDAQETLAALLGEATTGRDTLVEQGGGRRTALREGAWKYIPAGPGGTGITTPPSFTP